jgi:hypothetical protein
MSALALETIMTGRPIAKPASKAPGAAVVAWPNSAASLLFYSSGISSGSLFDDLRAQLGNLQRLVCELLSENQRLRMALMEANNTEGSIGSRDDSRDVSRWREDL